MAESTKYSRWVQTITKAWMGATARRLWSGFATALGDLAVDWMRSAIYQQHPSLAADSSQPLIGNGRRLYQGRGESITSFKNRLPRWIREWQRAGTPLGLLWALWLEGFRSVVLVQQNGLGYQLVGPIDPDHPELSLVVTELGPNPALDDHPWWIFDENDEYTSRFALIFPDGIAELGRLGRAVFTGTEDGSDANPWPIATFDLPFPDTDYLTTPGLPITDTPVSVATLDEGKTITTVRVSASAPFVGYVPVLAWEVGAHPFANMPGAEITRLRRIVNDWRPAKARCMGAIVTVSGELWGWPQGTWGDPGTWGPSESVTFELESF